MARSGVSWSEAWLGSRTGTRGAALYTLIRVARLMGKRFWPHAAAVVAFSGIMAVCFNLVLAFLFKDVIDAAVRHDVALVQRAGLIAVGTFVVGTPALIATRYGAAVCVRRTISEVRLRLFRQLADLPMVELDARFSGDLVSRATNDLDKMRALLFDQPQVLLLACLMGVGGIGAIFALDRRVGWVAVTLGLLTTGANAAFARPMRDAGTEVQGRSANLIERLNDLLQGLAVTRLYKLDAIIHSRYASTNAAWAVAQVRMGNVRAAVDTVNLVLGWLRNVGFLGLGLLLYSRGELALGSVWAIVALQGNAEFMFSSLGRFVADIQQSLVAAGRVFEILDREGEALGSLPAHPAWGAVGLTLNDVCFHYPGDKDKDTGTVLTGVTLAVAPGEVAALVGPSGGGKSTLIKLLLGFYPPDSGEILIGARRLTEMSLAEVRAMMAYVPQSPYLFDGTIEENIRMGRPEASHEAVVSVAKLANAHAFILAQPEGYQTRVGERGAKLSGGQRQRIAIARALLKDAPVLLLDEATSALDSESEALVQAALARLMEGRTTLAVAHRLSTVDGADVIAVIEGGRVVEAGTHAELVMQAGAYAELYERDGAVRVEAIVAD